jgi:hypothetical protein
MRQYSRIILSLSFTCLLSGCSFVATKMTGLHEPVNKSELQIEQAMFRLRIPEDNTFILDTSFESYFRKVGKVQEQIAHDHLQPLQVSVYNAKGDFIFFHINCYASGFPNLKWNDKGQFDSIPPHGGVFPDTTMDKVRHLSMILNFKIHQTVSDDFSKYDYLFIVHWNIFWKRQSKRLVKFLEQYKAMHPDFNIKIIYVNNDNLYS